MSTTASTMRSRIEAQGYLGLDDARLAEIAPWTRFAPALCMSWTAVATYFGSALGIWALVPLAAIGAFASGHPFEVLYNHGFRHMLGTARLPAAGPPRRFACKVGTVHLAFTGLAFYMGAMSLGYALGAMMVLAAAVPTFTGFCIPSFMWGLMFGAPRSA